MRYKKKNRHKTKEKLNREIHRLLKRAIYQEKDYSLAQQLVEVAVRISIKSRIKIPPRYNRFICRKCHTLLIPGKTLRVRVRKNRTTHITYKCLNCGYTRRFNIARVRKNEKYPEKNIKKSDAS